MSISVKALNIRQQHLIAPFAPVPGTKQRPSNTAHRPFVRLVKVGAPMEEQCPEDGPCIFPEAPPAQDFVSGTQSRRYLKATRCHPCPSPAAAPAPFSPETLAAITLVTGGVAVAAGSSARAAARSALQQPSDQHLQKMSGGPTRLPSASNASSHASKAQQHLRDCSVVAAAAAAPGNAPAAAPAAQQPQSEPAPDRSAAFGERSSQDAGPLLLLGCPSMLSFLLP